MVAACRGGNVWAGIAIGAVAGALIGTGVGMVAGIALAGSITATKGAVAAGASVLAATVSGGGVVAGAKMIADNVSQAVSKSPQVFWSGGEVAKQEAEKFANEIGGKTLEMIRLGQYINKVDPYSPMWRPVSANFANVASRSGSAIYSIQNAAGVRIQSTWATIEYPFLQGCSIIYGMVSQGGIMQIMP